MKKKHNKYNTAVTEDTIMNYLYNLNVNDFDEFYKDIILIRNGIKKSDYMMNYICTTKNSAALKRWITIFEDHYGIIFDAYFDRIFRSDIEDFINIVKTCIGDQNTNYQKIIMEAFDPDSMLNRMLENKVDTFLIVIKALYTYQVSRYDENSFCHICMYVIHDYYYTIHRLGLVDSYGYNNETNMTMLIKHLDIYNEMPITCNEIRTNIM